MGDLARTLAVAAVAVSAIIPVVGWLRGYDLHQMLLTWLSLTFLMVPGQPPIIITMALALAAFELARKQVIVRRLQGAETLGSVTTLLSDKTGTITENRMALSQLILPDGRIVQRQAAGGQGAGSWSSFLGKALLAIPENTNDPTDQALVDAAQAMGSEAEAAPGKLVRQTGFSTGRHYRTMEYEAEGGRRAYVAGSPEFVLSHSSGPEQAVWDVVQRIGAEGKRITAYAHGAAPADGQGPDALAFLGCAVLDDPIRPGVKDAVAQLAEAGVRTVMVTGDSPATASFVAREIGLEAAEAVTGQELESLGAEALFSLLSQNQVFARTTPEHKLRLAEALKQQGQTVAVTGDGINDAPALHTADIGVAMGIKGTDVAKEAADLVLTDDDFTHLPAAVGIGRKAYDNFRKGITYYLSAKAILLSIFVVPLLAGLPFPFSPIQIIVTELLMDLASSAIFVSEPAEPGLLRRKPRAPGRFLSRDIGRLILRNMAGLTVAILAVYIVCLRLGDSLASARTAAFATWLLGHVLLALNVKQTRTPLLQQGLLVNRFGAGWLVGMIALVLLMTFVPGLRSVLETTALAPTRWVLVVGAALLASGWIEVGKWLRLRAPAHV